MASSSNKQIVDVAVADVEEDEEEEGTTGARCSAVAVALMDTTHLSAPCSSLTEIGALLPDKVGTSAVDIADRAAVALDTARHGWQQ